MEKGKLYLIPTPLGGNANYAIPNYVIELVHEIEFIVAERAKTARQFIKSTGTPRPMPTYYVSELNDRTPQAEVKNLLKPALEGKHIGIMSEAGCPGVADPGARLVAAAHKAGITVVPMVGPSSILLALMASGMNGQSFCFHGYLPAKVNELGNSLAQLEQLAIRKHQTQLFIEAPYRNRQVMEQALKVLAPNTSFCVAVDLTLKSEAVITKKISEWQKRGVPDLHKRPAIFLIGQSS